MEQQLKWTLVREDGAPNCECAMYPGETGDYVTVADYDAASERIKALEEALRGLSKKGVDGNICWCDKWPHRQSCLLARAVLAEAK